MNLTPFSLFFTLLLSINHAATFKRWTETPDDIRYPNISHGDACIYSETRDTVYCLGQQSAPRYLFSFSADEEFKTIARMDHAYQFPHSVALFGDEIYFVNNNNSRLYKVNVVSGDEELVDLCPENSTGYPFERYRIIGDYVDTIYLYGDDNTTLWSYNISVTENATWEIYAIMGSGHDNGMIEYYDGVVYLFGGNATTENKIEYVDTTQDNPSFVTPASQMNFPSYLGYMGIAVVPGNREIYLVGGNRGPKNNRRNATYVYDIDAQTFEGLEEKAWYPRATDGMACTFPLFSERIWCMVGNTKDAHNTDYILYSNNLYDSKASYNGKHLLSLLLLLISIAYIV